MNESCHIHEWVILHTWVSQTFVFRKSIFKGVTWPTCMCYGTHRIVLCCTHEWVFQHIWMRRVKHMNESCHTHEWASSSSNESKFVKWLMSHTCMSHGTHMKESWNSHETFLWSIAFSKMSWRVILPGTIHSELIFENFYTGRALQAAARVWREYLRHLWRASSPDYYRRLGQCGKCRCIYIYVCM